MSSGNSNNELPANFKSNEYMLDLMKKVVEHRKVAESTGFSYIKTLSMLNDKQPFKALTFLKRTEDIEKKIAEYSENTQRTILSTITSVLSLFKDKPAFKKTYTYYYDRMMGKAKEMKDTDDAKKTDKQKDAWIEWKDVEAKLEELKTKVKTFDTAKTLTASQYETLLQYIILSLYVYQAPRRNLDYLEMYVVNKAPTSTTKNYLVLNNKKPQEFIFNVFKTQKTYNQQKIDLNDSTKTALTTYLKYHPLAKGNRSKTTEYKLLVHYDGSPLTSVNAITRVLNRIFSKKIGSSMLRHIYLSSKYDIQEMTKDSEAMGHSLEEQRKYMKEKNKEE